MYVHIYTFLYIVSIHSSFSNCNVMASRKPIKHERNVHNIKRHRSINRGSRVSKGARCRSIDGWRGRERGKLIREIWLWTVLPVRGSTWIRGTWDPTVAILPHLVTIQSTMPPLHPPPPRAFSIALVLHQFLPTLLLLLLLPRIFFPISIFVRISSSPFPLSFSSLSFNEKKRTIISSLARDNFSPRKEYFCLLFFIREKKEILVCKF